MQIDYCEGLEMLQDDIDALHCTTKMRDYWVAQGCDGSMANSGVLPTEMALNESLHIQFQKAFEYDLQNMTEATRERVANQAFTNARQLCDNCHETVVLITNIPAGDVAMLQLVQQVGTQLIEQSDV
jgi:hypothetical protein